MNKVFLLYGPTGGLFTRLSALKAVLINNPSVVCKTNQVCSRFAHSIKSVVKNPAQLNIDTKSVTKDIIIYKYENPRFYKIMNIFGFMQFFILTYFAQYTLSNLRHTPVNDKADNFDTLPWYKKINLGEGKVRTIISGSCFAIGFGVLSICWLYTLRSVRYLILRKGGSTISFVSYGPLGTNRIRTVPIHCISGVETREASGSSLALKVKNISWFYLLDVRGEYRQAQIFDNLVNVRRVW